jgi:rRNA maturation RNase YbeY
MNKIYFHELNVQSLLVDRKRLKKCLVSIFERERVPLARVDIIFCSDQYLLSVNKEFLKHNYFTDTVTFTLSDAGEAVIGESYISIDRVKENSIEFKQGYQSELLRVIIHSCLHLCGYNDKEKAAKKKMTSRQENYLAECT